MGDPTTTLRLALLIAVASYSASCQMRDGNQSLDSVLSGFELLEQRELTAGSTVDVANPIIETGAVRPRRDWQAGYVYLLRLPDGFTSEQLALVVLPDRLSQAGATILKAPRSPADLMKITSRGPLFRIEFTRNQSHGVIYNRVAKVNGQPEEILLFEFR